MPVNPVFYLHLSLLKSSSKLYDFSWKCSAYSTPTDQVILLHWSSAGRALVHNHHFTSRYNILVVKIFSGRVQKCMHWASLCSAVYSRKLNLCLVQNFVTTRCLHRLNVATHSNFWAFLWNDLAVSENICFFVYFIVPSEIFLLFLSLNNGIWCD